MHERETVMKSTAHMHRTVATLAWTAVFILSIAGRSAQAQPAAPDGQNGPLLAAQAVAVASPTPVAAPIAEPPTLWRENIGGQLAQMLAAPNKDVRAESMQLVILLVQQYPNLNFDDAVAPLVWTYEWDNDKANRILAVVALHAIGNPTGMTQLAQLVDGERSRLVRHITYAALADRLPAP
jgi:hypothetical protein